MNLTIEVPDHVGAALKSEAQTKGISAARYGSRIIEVSLRKVRMDECFQSRLEFRPRASLLPLMSVQHYQGSRA
jgi:hypothetical protein